MPVNVEKFKEMQFVRVCQLMSDRHQTVGQNARLTVSNKFIQFHKQAIPLIKNDITFVNILKCL